MKCDCCLKELKGKIELLPKTDPIEEDDSLLFIDLKRMAKKLNEVIDRINESESTNINLCSSCSKKGYEIEVEKKEKILEDIDKIRTILGTKEKDE